MSQILSRLKIAHKIPLFVTSMAILSAGISGFVIIKQSEAFAVLSAKQRLVVANSAKKHELSLMSDVISQDLSSMTNQDYVRQALYDFSDGWSLLSADQTQKLQDLYINSNKNEIGSKHLLDRAPDDSVYSNFHGKYHPWFRHHLTQRGYYDIFLINKNGDIVYTVFKELDFATNVLNGEWKDTDLAGLFVKLRDANNKDTQISTDFRKYAPSKDVPAAFIGQSIFSANGAFAGTLIFQFPIEMLNNITQSSQGLGKAAETYLVGTDLYMRSDSRFREEDDPSSILFTKVTEEAVRPAFEMQDSEKEDSEKEALNTKFNVQEITDYRGIHVFSAYEKIHFLNTEWAMLTEIDEDEVMAPIYEMEKWAFITAAAVLLGITGVSLLVSRTISRPITGMSNAMARLAKDDYDVVVPGKGRGDEIGMMAASVDVFRQNGLEARRLREEQVINEQRAAEERKRVLYEMADNFQSQVGGTIQSLSAAAAQLQGAAQSMEKTASQTTQASTLVATASEETSTNVSTVASATEEMSASAQEISVQVTSVARRSSEAANSASNTSQKVNELNSLVSNIGEVVNAIKDIAEQTNLLALNATIEAARAGEAGKGFAVVADEVKKLASETARKTEEIETRITQIQTATQASVAAMQEIIHGIADIDGMSASAAGAVEEQNAVLSEITRNIAEVSQASQEVSNSIGHVRIAAQETGQTSILLKGAADEISKLSDTLDTSVSRFLKEVRGG